jgi:membrane-bound inhibitor of C-type lysozyme
MLRKINFYKLAFLAFLVPGFSFATDLTIHLPGDVPVQRHVVQMQCDPAAVKLGLPSSPFPVEYINAGTVSLAVLPLNGKPLVFANVMSGSGARYAANRYIWWDAGSRGITLSAPLDNGGDDRGTCHVAAAPK